MGAGVLLGWRRDSHGDGETERSKRERGPWCWLNSPSLRLWGLWEPGWEVRWRAHIAGVGAVRGRGCGGAQFARGMAGGHPVPDGGALAAGVEAAGAGGVRPGAGEGFQRGEQAQQQGYGEGVRGHLGAAVAQARESFRQGGGRGG